MKSDLALGKLNLYKELGGGKYQMLTFGIWKETLRLYVREGEGGKNGKNTINMPVMFIVARALLNELNKLNEREVGYTISFNNYGPKWDSAGKRIPNERSLIGKIGVGRVENKDKEVMNILFVHTNQDVKKVFPLINTPYLDIYIKGKKLDDKPAQSVLWTDAYAKSFEHVLSALPEVNNMRDDSVKEDGGNGNKKAVTKSDDLDALIDDL